MNISELVGKTLTNIERTYDDKLIFLCSSGEKYQMYHERDCCENVYIEDICGDLQDLIGTPILVAEEVTNYEPSSEQEQKLVEEAKDSRDTYTWTFYKLATVKGYVTIRWFGTSNGYYSEEVTFILIS